LALNDHTIRENLPASSMYGNAESPWKATGRNGSPGNSSGGTDCTLAAIWP
jgi:hypothetical protein